MTYHELSAVSSSIWICFRYNKFSKEPYTYILCLSWIWLWLPHSSIPRINTLSIVWMKWIDFDWIKAKHKSHAFVCLHYRSDIRWFINIRMMISHFSFHKFPIVYPLFNYTESENRIHLIKWLQWFSISYVK